MLTFLRHINVAGQGYDCTSTPSTVTSVTVTIVIVMIVMIVIGVVNFNKAL
jgi:hypothetical protein